MPDLYYVEDEELNLDDILNAPPPKVPRDVVCAFFSIFHNRTMSSKDSEKRTHNNNNNKKKKKKKDLFGSLVGDRREATPHPMEPCTRPSWIRGDGFDRRDRRRKSRGRQTDCETHPQP